MTVSGFIDNAIRSIAPVWASKRMAARLAMDATDLQLRRTLDAGADNRLTKAWNAAANSGNVPNLSEVRNTRQRAWDQIENSGHAKKLLRALVSHNIGTGLFPESQATNRKDEPDAAFRKRSKKVWRYWAKDTGFYAKLKLGLSEVAASGEILLRKRRVDPFDQRFYVPFDVELIACERLVEDSVLPGSSISAQLRIPANNIIYRGMEFSPEGDLVAYHIYRRHPQDPRTFLRDWMRTDRIPADEIIHWFWPDRPDTLRGKTWMAPVLLDLRDVKDYKEDEMQAALAAACVTLAVYRKYADGPIGLNTPTSGDSLDSDDNTLARMQPGMLLNLAVGEKIEGFNPNRPNVNAVEFLHMLLRGIAAGLPGIKASTITGDYRESSFSSEKSADNDCWREIEMTQDWVVETVCDPVRNEVMASAVASGRFDDAMDFRAFGRAEFAERRREYLDATWSGPVPKSINPSDDAEASILEIESGLSNLAYEAGSRGMNWEENLEQKAKVMKRKLELAAQYGIPVEMLGVTAEMLGIHQEGGGGNSKPAANPSSNGKPVSNGKPDRSLVGRNGEDLSRLHNRLFSGAN